MLIKIIENIDATSSIDAVKLLIKYGADVNYTGNSIWTAPIYCCVYSKNIEIIELLIENGADINIKSVRSGQTPLTYVHSSFSRRDAIQDLQIFKLLIRKGSNINYQTDIYIKNNNGHNILKYLQNNVMYDKYFSLIFNYKNLKDDHFCEYDVNFIYLVL